MKIDGQKIKQQFIEAGFSAVGFLSAEDAKLAPWLDEWLEMGFQADMDWMKKNHNIRHDPASMEPYTQSLILLSFPYKTKPPKGWEVKRPISSYAWGRDYHKELKKRCKPVLAQLQEEFPDLQARTVVDSAPLPEKILAQKAGLGWIGKNSLLLSKEHGSYQFLAVILTNLPLPSDSPQENQCGSCRACIDSCPSSAILANGLVDARKCQSFLSIEKKGEFTPSESAFYGDTLFGCDLCQISCPYNQKAPLQENSPFSCFERWDSLQPKDVLEWSEEEFESLKINSPLKRSGLKGLVRNAKKLLGKLP